MTEESETFAEWLEQLELVAVACHWDEPTKLVNLVTRLKGQAFAFYRSCNATQRTQHPALVAELKKRFTPVHIQAVQSSLFHDRKQQAGDSVDAYAQTLKHFYKAYPRARQESRETESMGKSVLEYQFVSGLQSELKTKLAGRDGEFEQLLVRARFKEAKNRDLRTSMSNSGPKGPPKRTSGTTPPRLHYKADETNRGDNPSQTSMHGRCFDCGKFGHRARDCPEPKHREKEASGKPKEGGKKVSKIVIEGEKPDGTTPKKLGEKIESLRRQLREAEVEEAMKKVSATMHGVTPSNTTTTPSVDLGPVVYAGVDFEGSPARALVDTGSPVVRFLLTVHSLSLALYFSLLSLKFLAWLPFFYP